MEALARKSGVELDSFLEYFKNRWLLKTTVFSLTISKFYEAIFDWVLYLNDKEVPFFRESFGLLKTRPDAAQILASNSVNI